MTARFQIYTGAPGVMWGSFVNGPPLDCYLLSATFFLGNSWRGWPRDYLAGQPRTLNCHLFREFPFQVTLHLWVQRAAWAAQAVPENKSQMVIMDCLLLMDQVPLRIRWAMQKLARMEVGYLMLNLAPRLNGWSRMNQVSTLLSRPCLEAPEISSGFDSGRCIWICSAGNFYSKCSTYSACRHVPIEFSFGSPCNSSCLFCLWI